jgi:hypothetical protein
MTVLFEGEAEGSKDSRIQQQQLLFLRQRERDDQFTSGQGKTRRAKVVEKQCEFFFSFERLLENRTQE